MGVVWLVFEIKGLDWWKKRRRMRIEDGGFWFLRGSDAGPFPASGGLSRDWGREGEGFVGYSNWFFFFFFDSERAPLGSVFVGFK